MNKGKILLGVLLFTFLLSSCTTKQNVTIQQPEEDKLLFSTKSPPSQQGANIQTKEELMTVTELLIEDLVVGDGKEATTGSTISVHYTGTLTNGNKFDSSVDRGTPFQFVLGAGQVIKGWDQGVLGMKVGGKRKLTIPSDLAYGPGGRGSIPPNATLVFEVELLAVNP